MHYLFSSPEGSGSEDSWNRQADGRGVFQAWPAWPHSTVHELHEFSPLQEGIALA